MPEEYLLLIDQPVALKRCPECGAEPFIPFLRGLVVSNWRRFWRRPCWCLICTGCKQIVGYEAVPGKASPRKTLEDIFAYRFGLFQNRFTGKGDHE